jgi:hypothetical protein
MSLDLYSDEAQSRLDTLKPVSVAPVGMFDNYFEGTGTTFMQGGAKLASYIDLLGAVGPIIQDKITGGDEAQTQYFKEHEEVWGRAVDHWAPNPQEVGIAGQVTGQVLSGLQQLLIAPSLLVIGAQGSATEDLVKQGVDSGKAQAVGVIQGVGMGLGVWMPILGKTLAQRVVAGGVGFNVTQGVAMRGASGAILEGTPGENSYSAFDTTSLTLDVLMGAVFGGYAHINPAMRAQGKEFQDNFAAWAGKLKPSEVDALVTLKQAEHINSTSMPGKPVDTQDIDAHVQRVRQALDDLANDRPVNVEAMPKPEYVPDVARQAEAEEVAAYLKSEVLNNAELPPFLRRQSDTPQPAPSGAPSGGEARIAESLSRMMTRATDDPYINETMKNLSDKKAAAAQEKADKIARGSIWDAEPQKITPDATGAARPEAITPVQKVKDAAKVALIEYQNRTGLQLEFTGKESVDDNNTPVQFRAGAVAQEIKNIGWEITKGDNAGFGASDESHYFEIRKKVLNEDGDIEYVTSKIRVSNHSNTTKAHDNPDVNISPKEDIIWDIEEKLNAKILDEGYKIPVDIKPIEAQAKPAEAVDPLQAEAARFAQDNPDLSVSIGKNADGSDIFTTPRQMLDDADAAVKKAQTDQTLFEVAAGCIMGAL